MAITLEKVAEIAGVSRATASVALRGGMGIAKATRQRVMAVADQLGYRPNAAARTMVTGRREMVGFVSETGFYAHRYWSVRILGGLVKALDARGYHVVSFHADPTSTGMPPIVMKQMIDGVVLDVAWTPGFLRKLVDNRIPTVVVDLMSNPACDSVRSDTLEGARLATRHLLELGHRRVAFVGTRHESAESYQRVRWSGFVEEMSKAGLPVNAGGDRFRPVKELIAELSSGEGPTALVCFSDDIALETFGALQARGLVVPRDVSVVGFDDAPFSPLLAAPLTTVRLPYAEMGSKAAELIMHRLENPDQEAVHVVLKEELVVRASTAPPPQEELEQGDE